MKSLKLSLINSLEGSIESAIDCIKLSKIPDALIELTRGERIVHILESYDRLFPGRYYPLQELIKKWEILNKLIINEKEFLRNEINFSSFKRQLATHLLDGKK